MGSFSAAGTPVKQRYVFNSGTIDFGSDRLQALDNVTLTYEFTVADIYVLGSILRQDIARHTAKISLEGTMKSYSPELEDRAMGSSTTGTPQEIDILDGQPTIVSPVVTLFDRNGNEIQYQFINAMFMSNKLSAKAEEYAMWDFKLEAINVKEIYTQ